MYVWWLPREIRKSVNVKLHIFLMNWWSLDCLEIVGTSHTPITRASGRQVLSLWMCRGFCVSLARWVKLILMPDGNWVFDDPRFLCRVLRLYWGAEHFGIRGNFSNYIAFRQTLSGVPLFHGCRRTKGVSIVGHFYQSARIARSRHWSWPGVFRGIGPGARSPKRPAIFPLQWNAWDAQVRPSSHNGWQR